MKARSRLRRRSIPCAAKEEAAQEAHLQGCPGGLCGAG